MGGGEREEGGKRPRILSQSTGKREIRGPCKGWYDFAEYPATNKKNRGANDAPFVRYRARGITGGVIPSRRCFRRKHGSTSNGHKLQTRLNDTSTRRSAPELAVLVVVRNKITRVTFNVLITASCRESLGSVNPLLEYATKRETQDTSRNSRVRSVSHCEM